MKKLFDRRAILATACFVGGYYVGSRYSIKVTYENITKK